jgi:hypothetical protein
VVKGNSIMDAALGEAYAAYFCVNRGTADFDEAWAQVALIGTRE